MRGVDLISLKSETIGILQVSPTEVDETLKESMEHYLVASTSPDFVEDELMYDGFPLGEGLENVGRIRSHEGRPALEDPIIGVVSPCLALTTSTSRSYPLDTPSRRSLLARDCYCICKCQLAINREADAGSA